MFYTIAQEETAKKPKLLNPVTLAYIGDGIYELLVRSLVVSENGSMPAYMLHKKSVEFVCAESQSIGVDAILPLLDEDEEAIYRRGRNSTSSKVPKHADPRDYRKATGLEALFGYLYLVGRQERIGELFEVITKALKENGEKDEEN